MARNKYPLKYPIVKDPEILAGEPTIVGTRIPASLVEHLLKKGWPPKLISVEYPSLNQEKLSAFIELIGFDVQAHSL